MNKNGKKCPKNIVSGLFKKITSLILSRISVKESFYGSLTFWAN